MSKKLTRFEIQYERFLRGRLDYKLHDGQKLIRKRFRENPNQLFVGEISRQWGKSFLLVCEAIETAIRKPKARIKYATAFQTDLLEFILPTFDTILADCPEALKPVYKVQGSKWVFWNGSEIKLLGLDRKPNGLRGNVPDLIILDEAAFMSRLLYIYRSILIPATTHRPDCRILIFSSTPETPAHEFIDLANKAELDGGYAKFTIHDNPRVTEKTKARLCKEAGGEFSTTWRREFLCERVTDANLAIISEWDEKYVQDVERDKYFPFYHKYESMDLGVSHLTVCLFGYYDFLKAALIVEDEWYMNGHELTTLEIKNGVTQKESELWPGHQVYRRIADNNNPLLINDLSNLHQLHFMPTDKGTLAEMVNAVKMMVRDGQIIVHPRCKQLIGCLKNGIWDKHRRQFAESLVYGHYDALAALVYLVRNLNRSENPIPKTFEVDFANQILFSKTSLSQNAQELARAFGRGKR
jgi:hypothetical protein